MESHMSSPSPCKFDILVVKNHDVVEIRARHLNRCRKTRCEFRRRAKFTSLEKVHTHRRKLLSEESLHT